jgi:hypothetical protein
MIRNMLTDSFHYSGVALRVPPLTRSSLFHLYGMSNFVGKHSDTAFMSNPYSPMRATPVSLSTTNSQFMTDFVVIFQKLKDLFDVIIIQLDRVLSGKSLSFFLVVLDPRHLESTALGQYIS